MLTGVKASSKIQRANKTVFICLSIAAVVVTIAIVLAQFMVKQFMLCNQILGYDDLVADNLKASDDAYELLKEIRRQSDCEQDLTVLPGQPI